MSITWILFILSIISIIPGHHAFRNWRSRSTGSKSSLRTKFLQESRSLFQRLKCKPGGLLLDEKDCQCALQCDDSKIQKCCEWGWVDVDSITNINEIKCKDPSEFSDSVQEKCFHLKKGKEAF